jgi:hypothetical protein
MNYTDFDRISDTIIYLDNIHTLDFCTRLSGKDKNGYRRFYEYETQYQSNQYLGTDVGNSIKRNMNFYYLITNKNSFTASIILKPNDVYVLHNILNDRVLPWFFSTNRIFTEKNNRLVINGTFNPVEYIRDLQNWLRFEPIVIEYEDGTYKEGVRMTISSNYDFIDLNIDKFLELFSVLNYQTMYLQSQAQCNYAKMNPHGLNKLTIGGGLGSGGASGGELLAEQKYGYEPTNNKEKSKKSTNDFLNNAKSKKKKE